jgi:hypothetical protein
MRRLSLIVIIAAIAAMSGSAGAETRLDGAWALSGKWENIMGLVLKIEGSRYKYWFSGDTFVAGVPTAEISIYGQTAGPRQYNPVTWTR